MSFIVIDDNLRTMQIPSDIVLLGVESDDDVNKIPFQMPKEYCGYDLSTFEVRINYMNANGIGDIYIADDVAVDGDNMTFTWLVGRTACAYKGNTQFIVCLKKFDANQVVVQEFNTTVYSLPVLEGLETTEVVVQQNPDIIEHILALMESAGVIDPNDYYTKQQVEALLPTELPNPEALNINGQLYDGSEPVDITIDADSEVLSTLSGKIIHIADAVPETALHSLKLYNYADNEMQAGSIAVTNKNLFRIDLLGSSVTSKGLTFVKQSDGGIRVSGTSNDSYPMTSCQLSEKMFTVGETYTLSSGKTDGFAYVQLILNYTDESIDYIVARNSARSFTISKEVASCTGSVQITDSGVTVNNEVVYPQLECSDKASAFANNTFFEFAYSGVSLPVLPATICNIYPADSLIYGIEVEYYANTLTTKINEYALDNDVVTNETDFFDTETDYDLIIECSGNLSSPNVNLVKVVKGSILECEAKIDNGKPVNAIVLFKEDWSSDPPYANSNKVRTMLPLVRWYAPYNFISFSAIVHQSDRTTLQAWSLMLYYNVSTGAITNAYGVKKTLS